MQAELEENRKEMESLNLQITRHKNAEAAMKQDERGAARRIIFSVAP